MNKSVIVVVHFNISLLRGVDRTSRQKTTKYIMKYEQYHQLDLIGIFRTHYSRPEWTFFSHTCTWNTDQEIFWAIK